MAPNSLDKWIGPLGKGDCKGDGDDDCDGDVDGHGGGDGDG